MAFEKGILPFFLTLIAVSTGWGMVGCSSGPSVTRNLVSEAHQVVGMEVTYREGSPEYSHPAILSPSHLEHILLHIKVQPFSLLDRFTGVAATTQEAFSEEQRIFFSNNFSKALQEATPLETIIFYSAVPRGNGIWEITSGGLYIQEQEIHLVIPNYRHTIPATTSPQMARTAPLLPLGEPLYSLRSIAPVQQVTHHLATELWAPQIPHFVVPLQAVPKEQIPLISPPGQTSNSPIELRESIRQRLKNLETLRREELLTEQEYQRKRQDILEDL